jgi:hypothetical protein
MVTVYLPYYADAWGTLGTCHRALSVGSSYCSLTVEANEWMRESIVGDWHFYPTSAADSYSIDFENEADATLFTLRWA